MAATTTELWTADDVAAHLQVRRGWVIRQSQRGLIPAEKIGRYWRYDPAEIESYRKRRANPDPLQRTAQAQAMRNRRKR